MLARRAREVEDFTRDKSDAKDALLIARLVGQLHCRPSLPLRGAAAKHASPARAAGEQSPHPARPPGTVELVAGVERAPSAWAVASDRS
jgi:hypothetical protein